jgi:hypothetical protein
MSVNRRSFGLSVIASALCLSTSAVVLAKSVELLEFKLAKVKTLHLHDEKMAKSYEKSFKTLGVSCHMHGHDDHFDLTVECPKWKRAEFASHAEVEKWQKWLNALGFETKHSH